jgi:hypothetical protein
MYSTRAEACARFRVHDDGVTIVLRGAANRRSDNLVRACFASAWNSGCERLVLDVSALESCDDFVERTLREVLEEWRRRGRPIRVIGAGPRRPI